jgi:LUD domain
MIHHITNAFSPAFWSRFWLKFNLQQHQARQEILTRLAKAKAKNSSHHQAHVYETTAKKTPGDRFTPEAFLQKALPPAPRLEYPQGPLAHQWHVFQEKAQNVGAEFLTLKNPAELPNKLAEYFTLQSLSCQRPDTTKENIADFLSNFLYQSPAAEKFALPWQAAGFSPAPCHAPLPLEVLNFIGVVTASCAIAETGSVLINADKNNPAEYFLLPSLCVVLIDYSSIVADYETAWQQSFTLRLEKFANDKSRPMRAHLLTGPSRTADIEQQLLIGAHGPGRLILAVYD